MSTVFGKNNIVFEKVSFIHKDIIFEWLNEPYIKEYWDNSPEHYQDIIDFMNDRPTPSVYLDGIYSYWIGSIGNELYCLLMTAEVNAKVIKDNNLPHLWTEHLSKTGKTISIDFFIGNKAFFGKGYAASTLNAFIEFFKEKIDNTMNTIYLAPDDNNPRAKHIYDKAGFTTVGKFKVPDGTFAGRHDYLMVKNMTQL